MDAEENVVTAPGLGSEHFEDLEGGFTLSSANVAVHAPSSLSDEETVQLHRELHTLWPEIRKYINTQVMAIHPGFRACVEPTS